MSATGLIFLILFLVGIAVAIYYACLFLQFKTNRTLKYSTNDEGPLLAQDPDLNGNHESSAVDSVHSPFETERTKLPSSQQSCPPSKEVPLEAPPPNSVKPQTTPECAAKSPVKGLGPIVLDIECKELPESHKKKDELLVRKSLDSRIALVPPITLRDPVSEGDLEDGLYVPRSPPPMVMMMSKDHYAANAQPPPVPIHRPPISSQINEQSQLPYPIHPRHSKPLHPNNDARVQAPQKPIDLVNNKRVHFVPITCATALTYDSPRVVEPALEKTTGPLYPLQPSDAYPSPGQSIKSMSEDFVPSAPFNEDHEGATQEDAPPVGWSDKLKEKEKEGNNQARERDSIDISKKEIEQTQGSSVSSEKEACPIDVSKPLEINARGEDVVDTVDNCIKNDLAKEDDDSKASSITNNETTLSSPAEEASSDSSTDTSDPDVTEYSFLTDHMDPSMSTIIANEIRFCMDPPVTSYIDMSDDGPSNKSPKTKDSLSTPENLSASVPDSANLTLTNSSSENSLKDDTNKAAIISPIECQTSLGTPPNTPPEKVSSSDFIIDNPGIHLQGHPATPPPEAEQSPTFIVIEPHKPKKRRSRSSCSSSCSTSSSSSTSTTSSSEGSFHPNSSDIMDAPVAHLPSEKSKIPILKK